MRNRAWIAAAVVCAAAARPASAETFLLKDGGRVFGEFEEERKSEDGKQAWLVVRTAFGRVHVNKAEVEKRVAAKGRKDTLHLREARVHTIEGTASRSTDEGKTWARIPWGDVETTDRPAMPVVRAGERVRTDAKSRVVLDVTYGVVVLDGSSELRLGGESGATVDLIAGTAGGRVENLPADRRFRVETGTATLGVRGTVFVLDAAGDACAVGHGSVEFAAPDGSWTATVAAGGASSRGVGRLPTAEESALLEIARTAEAFPALEWARLPAVAVDFAHWRRGTLGTPVRVKLPARLIARTEVTVAAMDAFRRWCARNPGWLARESCAGLAGLEGPGAYGFYGSGRYVPGKEPDFPVSVPWNEAWAFAHWIGARLVTETEWDHAARGGEVWRPVHGDPVQTRRVIDREWMIESSGPQRVPLVLTGDEDPDRVQDILAAARERVGASVHRAGTSRPNPYGLFDLLGNVGEWTADAWNEDVSRTPADGSAFTDTSSTRRVQRGADFELSAGSYGHPQQRFPQRTLGRFGFRPAMTESGR